MPLCLRGASRARLASHVPGGESSSKWQEGAMSVECLRKATGHLPLHSEMGVKQFLYQNDLK